MNVPESGPNPKSAQFKEEAMSFVDEIYGLAFCLSNDGRMAEELTVHVYERGCRDYFDQFRYGIELRACLFRELFRTFFERKLTHQCED